MSQRYAIELTPTATRQLRKIDSKAKKRRIQAAVELLAQTPQPPGAKKLSGGDGELRVRTGDYRIIYEVHDGRLLVLVITLGHRREIYRNR